MNRKFFLLIGTVLLILAIIGGVFLFWSVKSKTPPVEPTPTPPSEVTPIPTPTPTQEEEEKSDLEQIREAFAEKYNKPISEVVVNISENTGTYASGGVRFTGEISGAMWLAYNDGEKWLIVFDGQGTIPCSAVDPYNFPTDMVPECWDETTEVLYTR